MNSTSEPKAPPNSTPRYLATKVVMMPRDTNAHGTIFGGVILSNIDLAGAAGAQHEIRGRGWPAPSLVTVSLNKVEFRQPVYVGDVVSFWTEVIRIGQTSITMQVMVETDRDDQTVGLTEAEVTFVAVDLERRHPVPLRDA
jgi:acyl-CoA thioesterase YciA